MIRAVQPGWTTIIGLRGGPPDVRRPRPFPAPVAKLELLLHASRSRLVMNIHRQELPEPEPHGLESRSPRRTPFLASPGPPWSRPRGPPKENISKLHVAGLECPPSASGLNARSILNRRFGRRGTIMMRLFTALVLGFCLAACSSSSTAPSRPSPPCCGVTVPDVPGQSFSVNPTSVLFGN